jgi:outer membrane beta-barrel protein
MKKSLLALWAVSAALPLALAGQAHAQMDFSLDEAEGTEEAAPPPADEGAATEGEGEATEGGDAEGDVFSALTQEDDAAAGAEEAPAPRPTETTEEIYAVQQVYALRLRRAEIAPSAAFNVNDPYLSHPGVGLAVNYWWTNVLAIGVNAVWYQFNDDLHESDITYFTRRSTRLAVPITQWQVMANLNFTYVPLYGKFSAFNKFIFQWDAYLIGGVGFMRTRPFPVIDPEIRQFDDFNTHIAFNVGLGLRVFLTRYLTVFFEFRDYMFMEKYENVQVALGAERQNPDTWLDDDSTFTQNATIQVGLTFFLPPSFEYRLPK